MSTQLQDVQTQGERMLALIRTRYPEYHPILAIADMAHDNELDERLVLDCHKTILKHVTPELKSVEVKADVKSHRRVVVSLFDGEEPRGAVGALIEHSPQVTAEESDPLWDQLMIEEAVAA